MKFKDGCIFGSDNGREYKRVFFNYLKQKGYVKNNIQLNNHRQLCFVENAILHLTKEIYKTDDDNWVDILQKCTYAINESRKKRISNNKKKYKT